jgi:hypothetical protein
MTKLVTKGKKDRVGVSAYSSSGVIINGWLDVFKVWVADEGVQVAVMRAESQSELNVRLIRDLDGSGEGIQFVPQHPPALT